MTRQQRTFYAAYRPYGIFTLNTNGPRADVLHGFAREGERDAWIAADEQHREAVAAQSREVRAARNFEERQGYQVIERHDDPPAD